jgi:signal transduction histidine kinase
MKVAIEERQRLVRDLHDAVSQKLYGLVTLTEATKARIDAGEPEIPDQVLTKIGENARQALKEMRLFLYELQPVDLEQGLVATLHHRLGAVEGRADVKARLLADEDIQLGPEKQIALYYISQEALNNVLRHAGAESVVVRLKQKRVNVHFEIEDDGCGFNLKKASASDGMGLKNMRERTELIGGKLKIHSTPGKGTKITVTVPKDSKPKRRSP